MAGLVLVCGAGLDNDDVAGVCTRCVARCEARLVEAADAGGRESAGSLLAGALCVRTGADP